MTTESQPDPAAAEAPQEESERVAPVGTPTPSRHKRSRTISVRRIGKRELERGRRQYPEDDVERPTVYGDCMPGGMNAERPCPFVSCKHHLYLDVNGRNRNIKLNFPDAEVWDLAETCTIDVALRGGATLEHVGQVFDLTRERVRQLEVRSLALARASIPTEQLKDMLEESRPERYDAPVRSRMSAPPSEDRTPSPPRPDGIGGPETATSPEDVFWCRQIGARLSALLCAKRHTSRTRYNSLMPAKVTYPVCAACADGKGVAARLGDVTGSGVTERRYLPVLASPPDPPPPTTQAPALRWFGEEIEEEPDEAELAPDSLAEEDDGAEVEGLEEPEEPEEVAVTVEAEAVGEAQAKVVQVAAREEPATAVAEPAPDRRDELIAEYRSLVALMKVERDDYRAQLEMATALTAELKAKLDAARAEPVVPRGDAALARLIETSVRRAVAVSSEDARLRALAARVPGGAAEVERICLAALALVESLSGDDGRRRKRGGR